MASALLHLAPESLESGISTTTFFSQVTVGILAFFFLERTVLWHHHHGEDCHHSSRVWLVTVGDTLHNFIDGVIIAGAFLADPSLGVIAAVAIFAHEIPQEISEYFLIVSSGMGHRKALRFNLLASFAALIGGAAGYFFFAQYQLEPNSISGLTVGMFLYIALADLIPALHLDHSDKKKNDTFFQGVLLIGGVVLIMALGQFLPHSHADSENHDGDLGHTQTEAEKHQDADSEKHPLDEDHEVEYSLKEDHDTQR